MCSISKTLNDQIDRRRRSVYLTLAVIATGYLYACSADAPTRTVTNGSYQLTVTHVHASRYFQRPVGVPEVPKMILPGHYSLTVHYVSDDPELTPERSECGSLSTRDGTLIELGSTGGGSVVTRRSDAPETTPPIKIEVVCSYGVPNDTVGVLLSIRDYPLLDLGIDEIPID